MTLASQTEWDRKIRNHVIIFDITSKMTIQRLDAHWQFHLPQFQYINVLLGPSGSNFHKEAPISMISQWTDGMRDSDEHEIIVLSQVLASPSTVGFTDLCLNSSATIHRSTCSSLPSPYQTLCISYLLIWFPYVQGFNNNQGSGNRLGSAGLFKALAHLDPRESRKRGRAGSY